MQRLVVLLLFCACAAAICVTCVNADDNQTEAPLLALLLPEAEILDQLPAVDTDSSEVDVVDISGSGSGSGSGLDDTESSEEDGEDGDIEAPPPDWPCGLADPEYVQGGPAGTQRVVSGQAVLPHTLPWSVFLRLPAPRHRCGGVLVTPEWVLTAAHCVPSDIPPREIEVRAGEHHLGQDKGTEQSRQVAEIHRNPMHNNPTRYDNDIALIKVDHPFFINRETKLVCLSTGIVDRGTICKVSGWGKQDESQFHSQLPQELQVADVKLYTHQNCSASFANRKEHFTKNMLCASNTLADGRTVDACGGDSGGPLICQLPGIDNWVLHGLVSWGVGCGQPQYPGVYTWVHQYLQWITETTKGAAVVHETARGESAAPAGITNKGAGARPNTNSSRSATSSNDTSVRTINEFTEIAVNRVLELCTSNIGACVGLSFAIGAVPLAIVLVLVVVCRKNKAEERQRRQRGNETKEDGEGSVEKPLMVTAASPASGDVKADV